MGDMIERVADALQRTANDHGFRRMTGQAYYEAAARAAIAAMREPTQAMIDAAGYDPPIDYLSPHGTWTAMIDAAATE